MRAFERGDVWWADLGIAAKYRPVIIVSVGYSDSDYAIISVIPHTTSLRGAAFEIALPVRGLKPGAFNVQGLTAVSPRALDRRVGTLHDEQLAKLDDVIRSWLAV